MRLDVVEHFVLCRKLAGTRSCPQTCLLQEGIARQLNLIGAHADPDTALYDRCLIQYFTNIAWRIDIGDIVGNDAKLALGAADTADANIHDGVDCAHVAIRGSKRGRLKDMDAKTSAKPARTA